MIARGLQVAKFYVYELSTIAGSIKKGSHHEGAKLSLATSASLGAHRFDEVGGQDHAQKREHISPFFTDRDSLICSPAVLRLERNAPPSIPALDDSL